MSSFVQVRQVCCACTIAFALVTAAFPPPLAAQDAPAHEPSFVRVGDDGQIIVKQQDGKERAYTLIGVEWPDSEADRSEARGYLKRLLAGEALRIEAREQKFATTKPSKDDAAAASPAYIRRGPDGLLVNSELIRLGFARVAAKPAFEQLAAFREVEKRARDVGKGIWDDGSRATKSGSDVHEEPEKAGEDDGRGARPKPPANTSTVYITANGDKYHLKSCRFAKNARAVTIVEAIQLGKSACAICKPPVKP